MFLASAITPDILHLRTVGSCLFSQQDGELVAVDPSLREQAAQAGSVTFVVNTNNEVCAVHKAEGIGLTQNQIMR